MKLSTKILCRISLILPTVLCCSCSLGSLFKANPPLKSYAYDLSVPEPQAISGIHVDVKPFIGNSRSKMAIRVGNRIEFDEKNRWVQPPETILTRYLTLAFASPSPDNQSPKQTTSDVHFTISGHLLGCIYDFNFKKMRMQVSYTVIKEHDNSLKLSVTKEYTAELKTRTAEAQAQAFSECANAFADDLALFMKQSAAVR